MRETSIELAPVADGRFEIYLDGTKVYDRKEPSEDDLVPKLRAIRKVALQVQDLMKEAEKVAT